MAGQWRAGLCLAGVLGILAGSAHAASPPKLPDRADLVKELSACRAIGEATARLACFDKAAAALDEAQAKGDVVVVDRQQVREVKRQAFGFRMDALNIFKGAGKENDDAIEAVAQSAHQNANGKWIVELEGGAIWRQIDDDALSRDPHQGSKIRIRRATLNSYMMNVDGQPGIRVHRDE